MVKRYEKYKDSEIEWIGQIPKQWELTKFKFCFSLITDKNKSNNLKIGLENIESKTGKFKPSNSTFEGDGITFQEFDILFGKLRPYLAKVWLATFKGTAVGDFFVFRTKKNIIPEFGFFRILSKSFIDVNNGSTYGAKMPRVSWQFISDLKIPIPKVTEQKQIVYYLGYQTNLLDQLINKKENLVQLLQEQRQAIINEAVTKGLNPKAKMKDSGIEWLGKVPEHWTVGKLGHFTNVVRGGSPRPAGDPKFFGGDFMPWITVAEVTKGNDKFLYETKSFLTELGSQQSRIIFPETLLLSNSGATLGVPKISKIKGCINDGSVAFLSYNPKLTRDFLYYFFITHTQIYRDEMDGSGQPNLNKDIIKATVIPIPPIKEQEEIIKEVELKKIQFDNLEELLTTQIQKLKEYRQSIISEAVTGKVDVREWQPRTKATI